MNTTQIASTRSHAVATALVATDIKPLTLGYLDAELGLPLCAEQYFWWTGDILEYVDGYASVTGETDAVRSYRQRWLMPPTIEGVDVDAELEELQEGVDEIAWVRRGC